MSDSDSDEGTITRINIEIYLDEDPANYPPIFIAARDGDVHALRAELASGVDPNLRSSTSLSADPNHTTPLGVLVSNANVAGGRIYEKRCPNESRLIECTRILLDAGADPCFLDALTVTAVYNTVSHNHPEILAMLLEAGAGAVVNNTVSSGWTALAQAARSGHMECLHHLLAAGADVNLRVQNDALDLSPLEMAIRWEGQENLKRVFPVLLRAGAAIPPNVTHPYVRKVAAAGGFAAYERAHRLRLATILARVVFPGPPARGTGPRARPRRARSRAAPRLPLEMVSHVVAFAFHTGNY
jgi:ankyrin repeat protein